MARERHPLRRGLAIAIGALAILGFVARVARFAATGIPDRETLRSLGIAPGDVYQTGTGSSGTGTP